MLNFSCFLFAAFCFPAVDSRACLKNVLDNKKESSRAALFLQFINIHLIPQAGLQSMDTKFLIQGHPGLAVYGGSLDIVISSL